MFLDRLRLNISKTLTLDRNSSNFHSDCLQEQRQRNMDDEFRRTVASELNNIGAALYDQGDDATAMELYNDAQNLLVAILHREHDSDAGADRSLIEKLVHAKENLYHSTETTSINSRRSLSTLTNRLGFYQMTGSKSAHDQGPQSLSEAFKIDTSSMTSSNTNASTEVRDEVIEDIAVVFYNMGLIFHQNNLLDQALQVFEETVRFTSHSSQSLLLAAVFNNIGHIFYMHGILDKAIDNFSKALQISRKLHDMPAEEKPEKANRYVGIIMSNMGRVYLARGQNYEALIMCQAALATLRIALGRNHIEIAVTLFNIGLIQERRGKIEESIDMYKQFLSFVMSRDLFSSRDVATDLAISLNHIGQIYEQLDMASDAMSCYMEVLTKGAAYIQTHRIFAVIFYNVGMLQYQSDDLDKALQTFGDSINLLRHVLGHHHADVAALLHDIGLIQLEAGKVFDALASFVESSEVRRTVYGNDQHVAESLYQIGKIYYDIGDYNKAMEVFQEAVRIEGEAMNGNHSSIAMSLCMIGEIHHLRGQLNEALNVYKEALNAAQACDDSEEISITDILTAIGSILLEKGETGNAMASLTTMSPTAAAAAA